MLTSLSLANFKKHKSLEIEFKPGVNLIIGPNWSGKTTVLNGIRYAIGGPSFVPGGAKRIKRRGANKQAKVELQLQLKGASYTVQRTGSNARLYRGKDVIATGPSSVNAELAELLEIDQKTFLMLRTSPQDEAGALLTLGASQLGQIINRITKIDVIDRVLERARECRHLTSAKLELLPEIDPEVIRQEQEARISLTELHEKMLAAQAESTTAEQTHQERSCAHVKLVQAYTTQESERQHRATYTGKKQAIQANLSTLREKRGRIPSEEQLLSSRKPAEDLKNQLLREKQVLSGLERRLDQFSFRMRDLETRIKDQKHTIESIELPPQKQLEDLYRAADQAYQDLGTATSTRDSLQAALRASVCQTCLRPLNGADPDLLKNRLEKAQEEVDSLQPLHKRLSQEQSTLYALSQRQKVAVSDLQKLTTEKEQARKDLDCAIQEARDAGATPDLEKVLERANQELHKIEQQRSKAWELDQSIATAVNELHSIEEWIQTFEAGSAKEIMQEELTLALVKADQAKETAASKRQTSSQLTAEYSKEYYLWQGLEARAKKNQEQASQRTALISDADSLKKLAGYLHKSRDRFTHTIWNSLLGTCSEFSRACTHGKIEKVERASDGGFIFFEEGQEASMAEASGVQRAIMGVGVRLALAQALRIPNNFLLLDEVTAGANDEISLAITQALAEDGSQVIMVTHRHSDAAVANHTITLGA